MEAKGRLEWTPLHLATASGHVDLIKMLLEKGASTEAVNNFGETPMVMARRRGHLEMIELLRDKEARKRNI